MNHYYDVLGRKAKPTRREKVQVGLIFDFRDEKKPQGYPL
jgi:hypothetical protein